MRTYPEKLWKAKIDTLIFTLLSFSLFNIAIFYFFETATIFNTRGSLFYQILLFNSAIIYILFQLFRKCNVINLYYRYQNAILVNFFVFLSFQIWKKIYISNHINSFILIIGIVVILTTLYQTKLLLFTQKK